MYRNCLSQQDLISTAAAVFCKLPLPAQGHIYRVLQSNLGELFRSAGVLRGPLFLVCLALAGRGVCRVHTTNDEDSFI